MDDEASVSSQPAYKQEDVNIKNMPRNYRHEGEYKLALRMQKNALWQRYTNTRLFLERIIRFAVL
ncbi:MAG: hypothetical protein QXS81_05100 [Candidatus Micrarchaeaceae archaeon]